MIKTLILQSRAAGRLVPLLLMILGIPACAREVPRSADGVLVVKQEQQASWVRNFNPLTPAAAPRWPTLAGVYEPLYVFNSIRSEYIPWLGVAHAWQDDNQICGRPRN